MAALVEAVERGDNNEAFKLIQDGHNVNYVRKRDDTYTALYVAAAQGSNQMVFVLVHYGADVNFSTKSHNTVLHAAANGGSQEIVRILLSKGAHINAANDNLDTALHISAYRGHSQVCAFLLSMGADASLVNLRGKSASDLAQTRRHQDTVSVFRRQKQDATHARRGCYTQELHPRLSNQMAKNNSNHTVPLEWIGGMAAGKAANSIHTVNSQAQQCRNRITALETEYSEHQDQSDPRDQILIDISNATHISQKLPQDDGNADELSVGPTSEDSGLCSLINPLVLPLRDYVTQGGSQSDIRGTISTNSKYRRDDTSGVGAGSGYGSGARRKIDSTPEHTYQNINIDPNGHVRNDVTACESGSMVRLPLGGVDECDSGVAPPSCPFEVHQSYSESRPVALDNYPTQGDNPVEMYDYIYKLVIELSEKDILIEQLRAENEVLKEGALLEAQPPRASNNNNTVDDVTDELKNKDKEIERCKYRNEKLVEMNKAQSEVIEQLKKELRSLNILLRSHSIVPSSTIDQG